MGDTRSGIRNPQCLALAIMAAALVVAAISGCIGPMHLHIGERHFHGQATRQQGNEAMGADPAGPGADMLEKDERWKALK